MADKGSYRGTEISTYYQSFSGTDTLAFVMLPGCTPVFIGSLTTISYSMYRNKKPVINIGRTNINGVTRGSRIYAGTMIFTLINQHWLKELQAQPEAAWLKHYTELKSDEMPLFDIMIISANEYGNCVHMYIWGIDITDEAQTISVEDLFTENTFSFIARDISVFKKFNTFKEKLGSSSHIYQTGDSQRFFVLDNSQITFDDLGQLEKEFTQKALLTKLNNANRKYESLGRDLYYSSTQTMMGNDVAKVQELLSKDYSISINGVFDEDTDKAVRDFQSNNNIYVDGIVNFKTYNKLLESQNNNNERKAKTAVVVNKHGAFVYAKPTIYSNIVDTKTYREQVEINDIVTNADNEKFYKLATGYVLEQDMYSAYYYNDTIEFPTIKYEDNNVYVTMIQSILTDLYSNFTNITGIYDSITEYYIKKLQEENGLNNTGIVDYQTWLLLQSLDNNHNIITNDNFQIYFNRLPGTYKLEGNILDFINQFYVEASCDNYINIKSSTICIYKNGKTKTLTTTIPIKDKTKILPQQSAFIYDPNIGEVPIQVDFIIYPYNKKPYKWTIML